jgi:serine/threonine-protein kinase
MSTRPETLPAGSPKGEESLVGKKVGKYELVRVIGRGGMGTVYEALHTGIGKRVAIKFVDAELARNMDNVARFQREAEAASAVESAHIVQIYDSGTTDAGLPYLVMELLRGEDLGHRIKRCGRLEPPEAVQLTAQILRGLHRAHEAGIIHRDLKPDNIFLVDRDDDSHFAKILDFGISKVQRGRDAPVHTLTREGTILGTPFYMSPEQAQSVADVDGRTDLWSVGAILYECLAGRPPHTGTTYEQVIVNICMKDVEDVRMHNPGVSEPLARVIARALARDREERFPSARNFLMALSVAAEGWIAPSRPGAEFQAGPASHPAGLLVTPGASANTPVRAAPNPQDPATFEPTLELKSDAPSRVGWSTSRKRIAGRDRRVFVAGAVTLAAAAVVGGLYLGSRSEEARGNSASPAVDSGPSEVAVFEPAAPVLEVAPSVSAAAPQVPEEIVKPDRPKPSAAGGRPRPTGAPSKPTGAPTQPAAVVSAPVQPPVPTSTASPPQLQIKTE